jgi:hypothetical protein
VKKAKKFFFLLPTANSQQPTDLFLHSRFADEGLKSIQSSADLLSARFKHTYPETL